MKKEKTFKVSLYYFTVIHSNNFFILMLNYLYIKEKNKIAVELSQWHTRQRIRKLELRFKLFQPILKMFLLPKPDKVQGHQRNALDKMEGWGG